MNVESIDDVYCVVDMTSYTDRTTGNTEKKSEPSVSVVLWMN